MVLKKIAFVWFVFAVFTTYCSKAFSQDALAFVQKVKAKIERVNDYSAVGKLKTDVVFLKVPDATVNVYYKTPGKFQISKDRGISILPRGGVNMNTQNLLADKNFLAIDAGVAAVDGIQTRVIKLLPSDNNSDVVLTTLYIDPLSLLIKKTTTTTKQSGTYDVTMTYGKYAEWALPDKVILSFNTKEYKLPKGVTLEFDDGEKPDTSKIKNSTGSVEITYLFYKINKGVPDSVFK